MLAQFGIIGQTTAAMISLILGTIHINTFILPLSFILAFFISAFLFWRAGRRELIDSSLLFDTFFIGLLGFIVGGRVFDFVLGLFSYNISLRRLVFFNVYGGFSFYGAVLGFIFAVYVFTRRKNSKFLSILDLMAAPLALGRAIYLLGLVLINFYKNGRGSNFYSTLVLFFVYFICFWSIKRLEKKKRFSGFFIAHYLIFTSIFGIVIAILKHETPLVFKNIPVGVFILIVFLIIGFGIWYLDGNAKKKINSNSFFAVILLSMFKIKRVMTSLPEADQLAKTIVLLPYSLVKLLVSFVKLTLHEVMVSLLDLVRVFGFKK